MMNQEVLQKYAAGERHFSGLDLSGRSLSWVNLTALNLSYANLSFSILECAQKAFACFF